MTHTRMRIAARLRLVATCFEGSILLQVAFLQSHQSRLRDERACVGELACRMLALRMRACIMRATYVWVTHLLLMLHTCVPHVRGLPATLTCLTLTCESAASSFCTAPASWVRLPLVTRARLAVKRLTATALIDNARLRACRYSSPPKPYRHPQTPNPRLVLPPTPSLCLAVPVCVCARARNGGVVCVCACDALSYS